MRRWGVENHGVDPDVEVIIALHDWAAQALRSKSLAEAEPTALMVGVWLASAPGITKRVSLSPVSAISDMVAPVVLITLAVIFSNALLAASIGLANSVLALDRERLGILRGPDGEMLDEDGLPPADRERLRQISEVTPRMIGRIERARTAVLIIWIAIGLLVLGVAAIAVAVTARSEAFEFTALALVLAGVVGVFAGIAMVVVSLAKRAEAVIDLTRGQTGAPG